MSNAILIEERYGIYTTSGRSGAEAIDNNLHLFFTFDAFRKAIKTDYYMVALSEEPGFIDLSSLIVSDEFKLLVVHVDPSHVNDTFLLLANHRRHWERISIVDNKSGKVFPAIEWMGHPSLKKPIGLPCIRNQILLLLEFLMRSPHNYIDLDSIIRVYQTVFDRKLSEYVVLKALALKSIRLNPIHTPGAPINMKTILRRVRHLRDWGEKC